jgi:hypothetical protein
MEKGIAYVPLRRVFFELGENNTMPQTQQISAVLPSHVVEEPCELCHQTGWMMDGPPWDPDAEHIPCPDCDGSGVVRRDYLKEAFLIVQDRRHLIPERKHLEAVIAHSRQFVSAAISLPEVN